MHPLTLRYHSDYSFFRFYFSFFQGKNIFQLICISESDEMCPNLSSAEIMTYSTLIQIVCKIIPKAKVIAKCIKETNDNF